MKVYQLHDTVLFVLSNKDLKRLKQTVKTVDTKIVGVERSMTFSLISEDGYVKNTEVHEMVKMKIAMMENEKKGEKGDKQQIEIHQTCIQENGSVPVEPE